MEAYESLAREYDIIVIEGAGSPAEINLQENDIVTWVLPAWWMRRCCWWATSTAAVCSPSSTARSRCKVKRTEGASRRVVNKFRGDRASSRNRGSKRLRSSCGVPVAGVVPYLHVDIETRIA